MISFQIKSLGSFMHKLLSSDCFDSFLLAEATLTTAVSFRIDGHQNKEFYTTEEWEDSSIRPYDFVTWKTMRPLFYDLVKGKRTPVNFKFVLHLMPEYVAPTLAKGDTTVTAGDIRALALNIKYDGSALTIVTGTAMNTFLMDKSPDQIWDNAMRRFLTKKEIDFEEI
ncbi:MAG: hypothetical protein J6B10_10480 [Lachnospiraceae bacterium]|nr:hypothetical protein [Lachnospiraceae bacterium]